jgi:proteasome accessory factor B
MVKLHHELQARHFPNCRKLADELEVSTKTIQRDIDFMRDRLGLPIEYDALRFGFYYTEPVTAFPSIEVTEGEIVALFVAQKALEQYRGTSFEKPLKAAFQKMSDGLQDRIAFNWADLRGSISFRGIGTTTADLDLFEMVSKAVLKSHELTFEYKKLKSAKFEPRHVQPYHLSCIENQWYLFAHDLGRKQLRTFALPRIRKAKANGIRFNRPADFSITKHLSGSFGVFSGREQHRVRIHFDAFAARLVSERQWHPSQKIKPLADGEIEIALQLGSFEEIERWILSWGAHARVLEPQDLVKRLRNTADALRKTYKN